MCFTFDCTFGVTDWLISCNMYIILTNKNLLNALKSGRILAWVGLWSWKNCRRRRVIKSSIGLHLKRILPSFTRGVMILYVLCGYQNDPPYWKLFNNLKTTSNTGRNNSIYLLNLIYLWNSIYFWKLQFFELFRKTRDM